MNIWIITIDSNSTQAKKKDIILMESHHECDFTVKHNQISGLMVMVCTCGLCAMHDQNHSKPSNILRKKC